jgi:molybdopterin-guanine dinucleotide biosynthesis protein A
MEAHPVPAILLAGGRATRLGGGDKCLRLLAGKPLLTYVVDSLRPQTSDLILNANGDASRFAAFGLLVVADTIPDHPGPLAGVLTGLDWLAAHRPQADFALSVSTDCPFLPADLVQRLAAALLPDDADIALAASLGQTHPVIALWRVDLRHDLRRALVDEGLRKVERFCDRHRTRQVNFPAIPGDPFFNVNTAEDLVAAEKMLLAGTVPTSLGNAS